MTKILRHIQMGLGIAAAAAITAHAEAAGENAATKGAPATQQIQADFEGLFSSDVQLSQSTLSYGRKSAWLQWNASVAYNTFGLDYKPAPFDFLGTATRLDDRRTAAQIGGKARLFEPLTFLASGGLYQGFTDFRSIWLNEYYNQQFSAIHGFGDEYSAAEPKGENASLGLRWEYLPSLGFIQGDFSYAHDEIAPGYEIDFTGLRKGRPNLYSGGYHVAFENVLTRRIRVLNEFRISDTTNRKLRYGYQGSLNLALGERWVLRGFGGYTEEAPTFRAHFLGTSLEFEVSEGWLLSVSGRYYKDTGEIENSLFSSAAPGLEAWQYGLGVRRTWGAHSFKFFAAPYLTRYEPAGIGTAFFQNLYRNRDWVSVQAAYTADF